MKQAFWKIPKEWVLEWGLTANEAILLADIVAWPTCSVDERAKRIGLTRKAVYKLIERVQNCNQSTQLLCNQSIQPFVTKVHKKCNQSTQKIVTKVHIPPHPPIIEEYIEEREEHITSTNVDVPKADASAVKKKSRKKPPEELSLVHRCRMIFEKYYLQKKGDPYYYLGAQDAMAIKQILQKIRFHMPDDIKDDEQKQEENFEIFVSMICSSPKVENWIIDNLSLGTINSKFNQIYSQLKNGTASAKPTNRHQPKYSAEFLADIAAGLAGGPQDIG